MQTTAVPTGLLTAVPAPRTAEDLPATLLALADADADAFADALHDGALQALVVARYAADAAVRGGDAAAARDAVQEALVALRRAVWLSRPRGDSGLAVALRDLAAHRATVGDAPLLLELDEDACAALAPVAASVAHRLVQRAAGDRTLSVQVTRTAVAVLVTLDAEVGEPADEAARARAAGGALTTAPDRTVLTLPLARPLPTEEPS